MLVQSAARDDDTDSVFELARDVTWVGGIVAWCPLDDEHRARARLEELRTRPKLSGVRHLINQIWPETTEGIERVAGLAADEILDTTAAALYRLDRLAGASNG